MEGIENFDFDFFFFEKFGNLEFFQGIENLDFFFFFEESWIFSRNWKFWIFFERNLRSTSLMPLVPRPFLKFFFLFFFWNMKICSLSKKWRRWRWRWSKGDEDLFMMIFFFKKKKPILRMRITLVGSWCGLLDKSLLNFCKKIISISNGFIHWNELEVLTQCP